MLIAMMGQSLAKLRGEAQLMAQFEHAKLVMLQEQNLLNGGVRERGKERGHESFLTSIFRSSTTREQVGVAARVMWRGSPETVRGARHRGGVGGYVIRGEVRDPRGHVLLCAVPFRLTSRWRTTRSRISIAH